MGKIYLATSGRKKIILPKVDAYAYSGLWKIKPISFNEASKLYGRKIKRESDL